MAERRRLITDADLLKSAESKTSDLGRLGLSGLPDALEAYGITDPAKVGPVVKTLSAVAFKALAGVTHPDRATEAGASVEQSEASFRTIYEALQNINLDPVAAVKATLMSPEEKAKAEVHGKAIANLDEVFELNNILSQLRVEKVETLFNSSYSDLFEISGDEQLEFTVNPFYLNDRNDGTASFVDTDKLIKFDEEDEAIGYLASAEQYGAPIIRAILRVVGNNIQVQDIQVVVLEKTPKTILEAYKKKHLEFFKSAIAKLQSDFDEKVRVVGCVHLDTRKNSDLRDLELKMGIIHSEKGLGRGDNFDLLDTIQLDPAKTKWVEEMKSRIYQPGPGEENWNLVVSREIGERYKIGLLGNYQKSHIRAAKSEANRKISLLA